MCAERRPQRHGGKSSGYALGQMRRPDRRLILVSGQMPPAWTCGGGPKPTPSLVILAFPASSCWIGPPAASGSNSRPEAGPRAPVCTSSAAVSTVWYPRPLALRRRTGVVPATLWHTRCWPVGRQRGSFPVQLPRPAGPCHPSGSLACRVTFRGFGHDTAHRRGDRFASGFLRSGVAAVDGVLPIGRIDGSAVSRGPFDAQC